MLFCGGSNLRADQWVSWRLFFSLRTSLHMLTLPSKQVTTWNIAGYAADKTCVKVRSPPLRAGNTSRTLTFAFPAWLVHSDVSRPGKPRMGRGRLSGPRPNNGPGEFPRFIFVLPLADLDALFSSSSFPTVVSGWATEQLLGQRVTGMRAGPSDVPTPTDLFTSPGTSTLFPPPVVAGRRLESRQSIGFTIRRLRSSPTDLCSSQGATPTQTVS
jgi:hypothetical protein